MRISTLPALILRTLLCGAAFGVGWIVYMVAVMRTTYDGALSILLQPFAAALASGLAVGLALVVGLVLRLGPIERRWTRTSYWALLTAVLGLFVLAFGSALGLQVPGVDPHTGDTVMVLHPGAAIGAYFVLVFAVANWPLPGKLGERGATG